MFILSKSKKQIRWQSALAIVGILIQGCAPGGDKTDTGTKTNTSTSTATATTTNTSSSTATSTSVSSNTYQIGIGLGWVNDYASENYYADLIRTSRRPTDTAWGAIAVDDKGWPAAETFVLYLWSGITNSEAGNYALTFTGRAASVSNVSNLSYNAATNTSSGTLVIPNTAVKQNFWITFKGAYRDATTDSPGAVNIKLMRPNGLGGNYPVTQLFNPKLKTALQKFSVMRFMDFLQTNGNIQTTWSTRRLPNLRAADDGGGRIGAPWEHVVLLTNYVGVDAWVNIPAEADDDYILKVAQLMAFGSDGATGLPYTGPYGSAYNATTNPRPAAHSATTWTDGTTSWYPPLNASRKLYVEYSNEVWNYASPFYIQTNYIEAQAKAKAPGSAVRYDNSESRAHARFYAYRAAQISLIFRKVFGDAAMMTRIRPVVEAQAGWAGGGGGSAIHLDWAFNYLNNGDGNHVPNAEWVIPGTTTQVGPHPPSYYFYGAGGAAYYNSNDYTTVNSTLTGGSMNPASWIGTVVTDMAFAPMVGVRRVAYEGGPSFDNEGKNPIVIEASATYPPANPNMQDAIIQHHETWAENGGDLLMYYRLGGDVQWGFLPVDSNYPQGNINNPNSPKIAGVEQLLSRAKVPLTVGTPFGSSVDGNTWSGTGNLGWGNSNLTASGPVTISAATAGPWRGYLFRNSSDVTAPKIKLVLASAAANSTVQVYFDGAAVGSPVAATAGTIEIPVRASAEAGLHGVIVRAVTGSFSLSSLSAQ